MANLCSYEMRVKGSKEARDRFFHYMDYDHQTKNDRYFARMSYDSDISREEMSADMERIQSCCAHSLYSCLYKGELSYPSSNPQCADILSVTKALGLEVEMWSEEPGCCFCEHFYVNKGEDVLSDCLPYEEKYNEKSGEFEVVKKPEHYWEFKYIA